MKALLFKILIFILLNSLSHFSYSQTLAPQWFIQIGGKGDDRGLKVIKDAHGNVYFTGIFQQESYISSLGYSDTINCIGGEDIYLGKIDNEGALIWLKLIGGKGADAPTDLMLGDHSSIYLSGIFEDSLFIDQDTIESKDYIDSFIAKYDSAGNMIWVNQIGGIGNQQCVTLISELEGNLLSAGHFSKQLEFPKSYSEIYTSFGEFNGFFIKWNPEGEMIWIKLIHGSGNTFVKDLAVDEENHYYLFGDFTDTIAFGPSMPRISSYGRTDVFIINYLQNGNSLWQRTFGSLYDDKAKCLTDATNGKVIMMGEFKDDLIYSDHVILKAEGGDDIFQITLNQNGNLGHCKNLGLKKNDFVFEARSPVGQKVLMSTDLKINEGNSSTLLASLGLLGDIYTVYQTGTDFNPSVLSCLMTNNEHICYCGSFHGTLSLDQFTLFSTGGEDMFLVMMAPEEMNLSFSDQDSALFIPSINYVEQIQLLENDTLFLTGSGSEPSENYFYNYPNPFLESTSIVFSLPEISNVKIIISDENGKVLKVWQFESNGPGIYSLHYDTRILKGGLFTCKLIAKGENSFVTKSIKLICGN